MVQSIKSERTKEENKSIFTEILSKILPNESSKSNKSTKKIVRESISEKLDNKDKYKIANDHTEGSIFKKILDQAVSDLVAK